MYAVIINQTKPLFFSISDQNDIIRTDVQMYISRFVKCFQNPQSAEHPPDMEGKRHFVCPGHLQFFVQAPPAGISQDGIERMVHGKCVDIGVSISRMVSQQPYMYFISTFEADTVQMHGISALSINADLVLSIPVNGTPGVIGE